MANEPPVVEASLDNLAKLAALRAKLAETQRLLAKHAPPRPRPWHDKARADQLIPKDGEFSVHLYLSGRGWGKSATGSNWIAEQAATHPDTEWAVIAPTWRDCRKVCIEGQSGILRALLPGELESCNASDLTVRLANGSRIYGYSADRPDRLRGANLSGAWCVARGTTVVTQRDDVPIEQVRVGDLVATRHGWRRVTATRRTGVARPTMVIRTSTGELRCTPDHLIAVGEDEWGEACTIRPGDTLLGCSLTRSPVLPHGSSSTVVATTATPALGTTTTPPATSFTTPSGPRSMVRYRPATRYTTETTTAVTTLWRIWNSLARRSTRSTTRLNSACPRFLLDRVPCAVMNFSQKLQRRMSCAVLHLAELRKPRGLVRGVGRKIGRPTSEKLYASSVVSITVPRPLTPLAVPTSAEVLGAKLETRETRAMSRAVMDSSGLRYARFVVENFVLRLTTSYYAARNAVRLAAWNTLENSGNYANQRSTPASTVGKSSSPLPLWPSIALNLVESVSVVLEVEQSLDCDVFDLTVEDAHEFYAGGVLVHNCDELASMVHADDLWGESLMPALRIGERPQVVVTTTPRPIPLLKELLARTDGSVRVVRGRTWDNAENLSKVALAELELRYKGTRMGRQELEGELLDDVEGALWTRAMLDATRVDKAPQLARIVVGVDPATTSGEKSDFTGIVVVGRSVDGHIYVLENGTMKGSPRSCMSKAVSLYRDWHADRIIGEVNNGGDYIESVLRTVDPNVPYKSVRATRGKRVRAEPVSALWEQGRGHIVGSIPQLEDQMCSYTPDTTESPDDMDAMCWAATELGSGTSAMVYLSAISIECPQCDQINRKTATVCRGCGFKLAEVA